MKFCRYQYNRTDKLFHYLGPTTRVLRNDLKKNAVGTSSWLQKAENTKKSYPSVRDDCHTIHTKKSTRNNFLYVRVSTVNLIRRKIMRVLA